MVPVVIGLVVGVQRENGAESSAHLWTSIVNYITHYLLYWLACFLTLAFLIASKVSWFRHAAVVLPLSVIIGTFAARPIFWVRYRLQTYYLQEIGISSDLLNQPFQLFDPTSEFFFMIVELYLPSAIAWTFFTALTFRYLYHAKLQPMKGVPPGARLPSDRSAAGPEMVIISKLKPSLGNKIRWMRAEGHYVRVCTMKGEDLIHFRFGDAIEQVRHLGVQTHRSCWVASDELAMAEIVESHLVLEDKSSIPIGPTFLAQTRDALKRSRLE